MKKKEANGLVERDLSTPVSAKSNAIIRARGASQTQ